MRPDLGAATASPWPIVAAAAAALRPAPKLKVSAWSERRRRIVRPVGGSGPWRNDQTPYLVEPMDASQSTRVDQITLLGPTQFGKSALMLNIIGHAVEHRPGDILVLQPSRDDAIDFVERRIDRELLATTPILRELLGGSRSDDTNLEKRFDSGMWVTAVYPTPAQLASKPVLMVLIDERDKVADNIGGEGDPVELARNRLATFGRHACLVVASSPSRNNGTGIIALFHAGDQRLWFVHCLDCKTWFSPGSGADRRPTFDHLYRPKGAPPHELRSEARLTCLDCGSLIDDNRRYRMNLTGVWVPEGQTVEGDGELVGPPPPGRHRSYMLSGLVNNLRPIGEIAFALAQAEREYERSGSEMPLQAVHNTVMGVPYISLGIEGPPDSLELAQRQEDDFHLRQVPDRVRFLTAAVDIQGNQFAVMVVGWREDGESWIIDRFALRQLKDGRTDIRPATHPEHWRELTSRVMGLRYSLARDPDLVLPIQVTAIDTGGSDGVTDNAKSFWRACSQSEAIDASKVMLIKGANTITAATVGRATFEIVGGKVDKNGPPLFMLGVHRLKEQIMNRLARAEAGPGYIHLPGDLDQAYLDEIASEEKVAGRFVKRQAANESLDLLVYNRAAFIRFRPQRFRWDHPPFGLRPQAADQAPATPDVIMRLASRNRGRWRRLRA